MQKVVYISGPITDCPEYRRRFQKAESAIMAAGYTVLSPANLPQGMTNEQYMRICFAMIDVADAVVMLHGWLDSRGAHLEADYCRYTGKPAFLSIEGLLVAEGVKK